MMDAEENIINCYKTIYDYMNKTPAQLAEIIDLEVMTIRKQNPAYGIFESKGVKNRDGSVTYVFKMKLKK